VKRSAATAFIQPRKTGGAFTSEQAGTGWTTQNGVPLHQT